MDYNVIKREKKISSMVAIMKYSNGLQFTGIVCEDIETAKKWLKDKNPEAFKIVPVSFICKDGEVK